METETTALVRQMRDAQELVVETAGWKLVPVEPTPKMLACLVRKLFPEDWETGKRLQARQRGENRVPFATEYEIAAGQYERMLAASPSAPQPPAQPVKRLTPERISELEDGFSNEFGLEAKHSADFARAVESACAAAWGVNLEGGAA